MSFQKQKHLEWEEGRTGEQGGERKNRRILSLLRKLCFWKVSLTQKSPSTHLLHTLRAISSLAAPLQGEDNVQLLFASSSGLRELWGAALQGRARQGPARQGPARAVSSMAASGTAHRNALRLCPGGSAEPCPSTGMRADRGVTGCV